MGFEVFLLLPGLWLSDWTLTDIFTYVTYWNYLIGPMSGDFHHALFYEVLYSMSSASNKKSKCSWRSCIH